MAINKNSNLYIIIYTVVMVVIVGALLAFLATSLKERQDANVLNEQKVSIMKAFGEADASFDEVVTMGRLVGGEFVAVDENNAADVQAIFDMLGNRKALAEAVDALPIFKMENEGVAKFVLPIVGKGLWGDIWGYVALQQTSDNVVITGIVMDHAGETPGLGAEVATQKHQAMYKGKTIFEGEEFVSVTLRKGGAKDPNHEVDAISGGTKTSDGVTAMLKTSLGAYLPLLKVSAVAPCCAECAEATECETNKVANNE